MSDDRQNYNADLAKRQNEINQWDAGNKLDTLFVYQQILIILCAIIIMTYLFKQGFLSSTAFWSLTAILVLIVIFTIVNRAQYTYLIRDTRYWDKRQFPVNMTPIPSINICP